MIVAVPTFAPVAVPLAEPIVIILVSLDDHVPPPGELMYVVDVRLQKPELPTIGDGNACTVTVVVRAQPVGKV